MKNIIQKYLEWTKWDFNLSSKIGIGEKDVI